jgi:hypothetical protein
MAKNADHEGTAKSRAEQLRSAVEGAFGATAQGAAPVQKRAQELADEVVGAAARLRDQLVGGDELAGATARLRDVLDELRPPWADEVNALRERVATLEARVAELEQPAPKKPAAAKKPARAAAKKPAAPRAKKAAAKTTAPRRPAGGQRG